MDAGVDNVDYLDSMDTDRANTKPTLLDRLFEKRLAFHDHIVRKGGINICHIYMELDRE